MVKMEKDNDSMVVKPVEYAASEYSSSSEPPPAYKLRSANSVKIAKIVAFTVILSSFILGSFMLASTYLQAKATCDQVSALDAILDKELMLETMQQDLPKPEALLSQENNANNVQDLSKDEMNKPNKKDQANLDEVENINEEDETIDNDMKRVHVKLPLDFDLTELAHNILMNNQKSRMNCVVERRRTEEVEEPKSMNPFINLMSEAKKEKVTGERLSIFCETGEPKVEQDPMIHIRRIVLPFPMGAMGPQFQPPMNAQFQPPMNAQFTPVNMPPRFPPQFFPPEQPNMPMNFPQPPQTNFPQPQMRIPFQRFPQQVPPMPAQMMSPPRPEVPQFRLINPAPQQQQLPSFERPQQMPNFERPQQMPNFERPQQMPSFERPQQLPSFERPQQQMPSFDQQEEPKPEVRIQLRRIQIPGPIGDIFPFLNNIHSEAAKELDTPRQNVQIQQMPLAVALSKVGITPEDLKNIQRMAEEKFQEHIRELVADEDDSVSDSDSQQSEEENDSAIIRSGNMEQDSSEQKQEDSTQKEQSQEQHPQILALGRSNFGRSLNPVQLPGNSEIQEAERAEFVQPR